MTVAMNHDERLELVGRIVDLEDALAEYLRVMERIPFEVEGDLRGPYLFAHGSALEVLPPDRWPTVGASWCCPATRGPRPLRS